MSSFLNTTGFEELEAEHRRWQEDLDQVRSGAGGTESSFITIGFILIVVPLSYWYSGVHLAAKKLTSTQSPT